MKSDEYLDIDKMRGAIQKIIDGARDFNSQAIKILPTILKHLNML